MGDLLGDRIVKDLTKISSTPMNIADIYYRQILMINLFQGLKDDRFMNCVDALEDSLAYSIDEEYKAEVKELETFCMNELEKKLRYERNIYNKDEIKHTFAWMAARLKYRALHRLLGRTSYTPRSDVADLDPGFLEDMKIDYDDDTDSETDGEGTGESSNTNPEKTE